MSLRNFFQPFGRYATLRPTRMFQPGETLTFLSCQGASDRDGGGYFYEVTFAEKDLRFWEPDERGSEDAEVIAQPERFFRLTETVDAQDAQRILDERRAREQAAYAAAERERMQAYAAQALAKRQKRGK